ncbi:MAG: hypothetical protein OEY23_09750 [Acidimicrobiia bacterium]|nr:hypothetical protein [Acidimicrobiia bacterium]
MTRARNWPLLLLALYMVPVGVQATLLPGSFYDDFPVDRGWVAAAGGAYNEHLVRDVGVLFVALVIAAAWTGWRRVGDQAVAVAWLVQGLAHVAFHAAHLRGLGAVDQLGLLVSLAIVPVAAGAALFVTRAEPR